MFDTILKLCLIGANDSVEVESLVRVSQRPWIETGICLENPPGRFLRPSDEWLAEVAQAEGISVSYHFYGNFGLRLLGNEKAAYEQLRAMPLAPGRFCIHLPEGATVNLEAMTTTDRHTFRNIDFECRSVDIDRLVSGAGTFRNGGFLLPANSQPLPLRTARGGYALSSIPSEFRGRLEDIWNIWPNCRLVETLLEVITITDDDQFDTTLAQTLCGYFSHSFESRYEKEDGQ